ncbi:hypothetical protein GCM10027258_93310 [Amycolatopsis stemonae]
MRALLYRAPKLTPNLVEEVCDRLLIPCRKFPTEWDRGYEPFPRAEHVLEELAEIAPVVALSNMAVTGGPERVAAVKRAHGRTLTDVYASWALGAAKPTPWLWNSTAGKHKVVTGSIVHIGDQLVADVYGAWTAGARVVHLRTTSQPAVYPNGSGDRIVSVTDLADAVPVVRAWAERKPLPEAAGASHPGGESA